MAGHSKYKNIMHRKGRADAQRSKLFSKLSRDITVAAKLGMPDVNMNPRLRLAVNNAKAESLPKDVIQRAINKAAGGDVDTMEEVRYEGRGPGGVGIIGQVTHLPRQARRQPLRSSTGRSDLQRKRVRLGTGGQRVCPNLQMVGRQVFGRALLAAAEDFNQCMVHMLWQGGFHRLTAQVMALLTAGHGCQIAAGACVLLQCGLERLFFQFL